MGLPYVDETANPAYDLQILSHACDYRVGNEMFVAAIRLHFFPNVAAISQPTRDSPDMVQFDFANRPGGSS